jgi:aldehyde dehydrogenase (NAD+)
MEREDICRIIESQRKYFATGKTQNINYRLEILKQLRTQIILHEKELVDALWKDFHKPEFEVVGTETRFVISEINHIISRLRGWARSKRVRTPIVHFLSRSYVAPQPYGQVLILSPWNFPFQLAFMPLVGAIAAGNCVILKVSSQVPESAGVMKKILNHFPGELISMIDGDHSINDYLLDQKFDYIFFTGSQMVGKYVMHKAAENLTPVSLELGGKNPCVIAADARLDYAAKRIAWGKFINCGQICVSPDYVLVDIKVRDKFLELISQELLKFYGKDPEKSNDFARVISSASAERLTRYINEGLVVTGGTTDPASKYVAPTIIKDVKPTDAIMQDEIFGPVLPVIDFKDFEEVYGIIERNPKPLATYIFSGNKKLIQEFMLRTRSGTAAVN